MNFITNSFYKVINHLKDNFQYYIAGIFLVSSISYFINKDYKLGVAVALNAVLLYENTNLNKRNKLKNEF